MTKLQEKLSRLLALTASSEENEARNAAHLLLKLCREKGVKIVFKTPREEPAPPAVVKPTPQEREKYGPPTPQERSSWPTSPFGGLSVDSVFTDKMRDLLQDLLKQQPRGPYGQTYSPPEPSAASEEFKKAIRDADARGRAAAAGRVTGDIGFDDFFKGGRISY